MGDIEFTEEQSSSAKNTRRRGRGGRMRGWTEEKKSIRWMKRLASEWRATRAADLMNWRENKPQRRMADISINK